MLNTAERGEKKKEESRMKRNLKRDVHETKSESELFFSSELATPYPG